MSVHLQVCIRAEREEFVQTEFCGEHNIFALVKSGCFRYRCDGREEIVEPLEGVHFVPGMHYSRHVIAPLNMYLFRFKTDETVFNSGKVTFRDTARIQSTLALLDSLEEKTLADDFLYRASLFKDIVNQYRMENAISMHQSVHSDEVVLKATAHLQRHFHENISLPDVAAMCNLSYAQFFRRFQAATGATPFDYLASLRIAKAKQLLIESTLPLRTIAAECGFNSEYYFSNFFKKHARISPSAFRQNLM